MEGKSRKVITTAGIAAFLAGVYGSNQESPVLMKDRAIEDSTSNKWNERTRNLFYEIAAEYTLGYSKRKNIDNNEELNLMAKRFTDFFSKILPNLDIVIVGEEDSKKDKIKVMAAKALQRTVGRVDYPAFYIGKTIYLDRSELLESFIAEASHQINSDDSFGRYTKYLLDYKHSGINQENMYDRLPTLEFQAHSITEPILRICLDIMAKNDLTFSFSEIYDSFYKIYSNLIRDIRKDEEEILSDFFTIILPTLVKRDYDRFIKSADVISENFVKIKQSLSSKATLKYSRSRYLDNIFFQTDLFEPLTLEKIKEISEALDNRKSSMRRGR